MDQTQRINHIVNLLIDADKSTEDNDNNIETILHNIKNEILSVYSNDCLQDEVKHILLELISKHFAHEDISYGIYAANLCEYI
jgi:hypothetical protein